VILFLPVVRPRTGSVRSRARSGRNWNSVIVICWPVALSRTRESPSSSLGERHVAGPDRSGAAPPDFRVPVLEEVESLPARRILEPRRPCSSEACRRHHFRSECRSAGTIQELISPSPTSLAGMSLIPSGYASESRSARDPRSSRHQNGIACSSWASRHRRALTCSMVDDP